MISLNLFNSHAPPHPNDVPGSHYDYYHEVTSIVYIERLKVLQPPMSLPLPTTLLKVALDLLV